MSLKKPAVKITGIAVLAALSASMQCMPPLFVTPWYMRIDLVAVPWVLCWILFGLKAALLSLLISIPIVGYLGPFAGGWIGAVMKSVSSVWMFTVPAVFAWRMGGTQDLIGNKKLYVLASLIALATRASVCIFFNFYFALPVFFGLSAEEIIQFFSNPGFLSFIGHSLGLVGLGAFIAEIVFWNIIQGVLDIYVSLLIGLIVLQKLPGVASK